MIKSAYLLSGDLKMCINYFVKIKKWSKAKLRKVFVKLIEVRECWEGNFIIDGWKTNKNLCDIVDLTVPADNGVESAS